MLFQLVNQNDWPAIEELLSRFEPLIKSKSRVNGCIDDDIAQDIRETFFRALRNKSNKTRLNE